MIAACSLASGCGDDQASSGQDAAVGAASDTDAKVSTPSGKSDAGQAAVGDARVTTPGEAATDAGPGASDGSLPSALAGDASTAALAGWHLAFADEFDGASGTLPDPTKWVFETGGGGFGNNELEYYTMRPENASLDGQGKLVITARAETPNYMGSKYTSARLKTAGKFEHTYGRYEARLRIPKGQGVWPAFWLLGADIATNPWPKCGEIDIMENIGKEPTLVHGTIHGPEYSGASGIGKSYELPNKAPFSDDFHVFTVEWEANIVRWYVDGVLYQTRTPADLNGKQWVYDHPFFILLNFAVGGQWPGSPDGSTVFPQTLTVDYVRVYDRD